MSPDTPSKYKFVGSPLNSPIVSFIHERLFQLSKRNSIYDLYEISQQNFSENITELLQVDGLDLTAPYKQEIIKYLDSIDEKSALYNAVTTVNCGVKRVGHNTESYGFLQGLHAMGAHLHKSSVLLVGVGEYAKMVAVETVLAGSNLTICAVTENITKAEILQETLMNVNASAYISVVNMADITGAFDLIVNASPIGMYPHLTECPISEKVIQQAKYIYDLICKPAQTVLLKLAEANHIACSNGISMLVWQAVASHCIWYNADFKDEDIQALIAETQRMVEVGFSKSAVSDRACQI